MLPPLPVATGVRVISSRFKVSTLNVAGVVDAVVVFGRADRLDRRFGRAGSRMSAGAVGGTHVVLAATTVVVGGVFGFGKMGCTTAVVGGTHVVTTTSAVVRVSDSGTPASSEVAAVSIIDAGDVVEEEG